MTDLQLGNPASAYAHFEAARDWYAALPAVYARDARVRRERAANLERLGDCLWRTGRSAEAGRCYQTVLTERELHRKQKGPNNPGLVRDAALSQLTIGDLSLIRGEPARACEDYFRVFETFNRALAIEPDDMNAMRDLAAVHYRLGVVVPRAFAGLGLPAQALAAWHFGECRRLRTELAQADSKDVQGQMELLLALARCGRTDEAEKVADVLLERARDDRRILFQVACGLSVAGSATGPAADRCRKEAWKVLDTLVDRGWKDRVSLETEPDLEAVRRDPRFRTLLDRIPTKAAEDQPGLASP
jgi:tetratricopeptide (TPR) repeat protein